MKKMLRTAAALVLAGCMMTANVFAAPTFKDVPSTHWGYTFITQAANAGLVSGMGDGTFGVDTKLSAAQFTTMVCNLLCKDEVDEYYNTYKPNDWWRSYMAIAYTKGYLKNTTVGDSRASSNAWSASAVNAEISRYDMAQIMVNVADVEGWSQPTTLEILAAQSKIGDWSKIPAKYQTAVATAYAKEYLSGMDTKGTFAGDQSMTRTHGAVVICKLMAGDKTTTAPTYTNTTKLVNGKEPTESNVVSALNALKTEFGNGYIWNMQTTYKSTVLGNSTGDDAFAYMLADRVFGNLALDVSEPEELKPGDIVHLSSSQLYVVVTDVSRNDFTYVSCNSSGRVTWGNTYEIADLTSWDTIYTRYEGDGDYSSSSGDGTLSNGKAVTASNVKALIDKFLDDKYQVGDTWEDDDSYKSTYFKNRTVYGNEAFAYYLSDYVFDELDVTEVDDFDDLRVGDVIYYDTWDEYLVVTKVNNSSFGYVGVYEEEVYDGTMDYDDLDSSDYAYTRYPNSSSGSGSDTLSNGKSVTASNVKALIDKFLGDKYQVGDTWEDDDSYKSTYFKNRTVYGNEAFAYYLSDYVFDELEVTEVYDFDELRVGDVIYYESWGEYLVITNISGDTLKIVGVDNEEVYEYSIDADNLGSDDYAYTRYPNSSSGSGSDTLSNGKSVTASNVKALINKFLEDEYQIDDIWEDDDSYKSTYFKNRTVYGNEAFAYYLSDYVFDDLEVTEVYDFDDLRVGDVIYYDTWDEYLVVTKISGDTIEFVGVYREEVYVDDIDVDDLGSDDYAYTRYPD